MIRRALEVLVRFEVRRELRKCRAELRQVDSDLAATDQNWFSWQPISQRDRFHARAHDLRSSIATLEEVAANRTRRDRIVTAFIEATRPGWFKPNATLRPESSARRFLACTRFLFSRGSRVDIENAMHDITLDARQMRREKRSRRFIVLASWLRALEMLAGSVGFEIHRIARWVGTIRRHFRGGPPTGA